MPFSTTYSTGRGEPYYDVGTFVSQNAFALTQKAAQQSNGVGFVNIDGNAVYYDRRPDQALAAALLQGNLQRIS